MASYDYRNAKSLCKGTEIPNRYVPTAQHVDEKDGERGFDHLQEDNTLQRRCHRSYPTCFDDANGGSSIWSCADHFATRRRRWQARSTIPSDKISPSSTTMIRPSSTTTPTTCQLLVQGTSATCSICGVDHNDKWGPAARSAHLR